MIKQASLIFRNYRVLFLLIFSFMLLNAQYVLAQSFDCAKASTDVEKLICGNDNLSMLDAKLSDLYVSAMKDAGKNNNIYVRNNQKEWLNYRDTCKNVECLTLAYNNMIEFYDIGMAKHLYTMRFRDLTEEEREDWKKTDRILDTSGKNFLASTSLTNSWQALHKYYDECAKLTKAIANGEGKIFLPVYEGADEKGKIRDYKMHSLSLATYKFDNLYYIPMDNITKKTTGNFEYTYGKIKEFVVEERFSSSSGMLYYNDKLYGYTIKFDLFYLFEVSQVYGDISEIDLNSDKTGDNLHCKLLSRM